MDAAAVEYLAAGETKVESFTFTLCDGHGGGVARTVDVTITGSNDRPSWRPWVRRLSPSTTT